MLGKYIQTTAKGADRLHFQQSFFFAKLIKCIKNIGKVMFGSFHTRGELVKVFVNATCGHFTLIE